VPRLRLPLDRTTVLVVALLPAGSFWMGDDEPPRLRVTLTRPFYAGIHPVTQAQWWALMRSRPARFHGPDRPADSVNWDDCRSFCKKLSDRTGYVVRLPSEAEWEYACRAGTTTRYCSGDEETDLERVAWSRDEHTHPVGQRQPNGWGLYDMHGNVWEWCRDADGPFPDDGAIDPVRDHASAARICKGGSYGNPTRSGNRIGFMGGGRNDFIGCRVVIEWQEGKK
jgi:formylglycine-generating enzyme required for sulfatase activity